MTGKKYSNKEYVKFAESIRKENINNAAARVTGGGFRRSVKFLEKLLEILKREF